MTRSNNCLWVVQRSSYLQRLIGTVLRGLLWFKCFSSLDGPIILGAPVEAPHGPAAFGAGRIKSRTPELQTHNSKGVILRAAARIQANLRRYLVMEHGLSDQLPQKLNSFSVWLPVVDSTVKAAKFKNIFSSIASQLNWLLKKDAKYQWSTECQFDMLKNCFTFYAVMLAIVAATCGVIRAHPENQQHILRP
ncbi:hypothetical protein T10_9023 [Trichinella papuae]|uniref:Uncharacterized protein n=1 Tax=Trichinella papuae TaxID=268474 RepID=A0A0V1N3Z4_9BILA|nr:hypothetical protein T10_9023 [Trichinella papuae]